EEAAAVLTRHAPIAAAMSAFTRAFQQESRSTRYPDEEIRRLLDGQAMGAERQRKRSSGRFRDSIARE
ncbi:hypothetical protein ABZV58_29555, partial [Nocardia sp. NPDC004654]